MENIITFISNLFHFIFNGKKISTTEISVEPAKPIIINSTQSAPEEKIENLNMSGSEFGKFLMDIPPSQQREDLIFQEISKGNFPNFMKNFVEITITDKNNVIKYSVSPDVLCVGSDDDFLRVPLNPLTARMIADSMDCILPTRKIANQIWQNATVKLKPLPNGAPYDDTMQTTEKFVYHNNKIESQRMGQSGLISGHKKDIVICKSLLIDNSKVAIYGWFLLSGAPIQSLNATSHSKSYKDYSHGVRLISRNVSVNGKQYDIYDVLKDSNLCNLISDEGSYDAKQIYK